MPSASEHTLNTYLFGSVSGRTTLRACRFSIPSVGSRASRIFRLLSRAGGGLRERAPAMSRTEAAKSGTAAPVRCQRIGCDAVFSDDDNPEGSYQYHPSVSSSSASSDLPSSPKTLVPDKIHMSHITASNPQ
jgi:hypothetical protein